MPTNVTITYTLSTSFADLETAPSNGQVVWFGNHPKSPKVDPEGAGVTVLNTGDDSVVLVDPMKDVQLTFKILDSTQKQQAAVTRVMMRNTFLSRDSARGKPKLQGSAVFTNIVANADGTLSVNVLSGMTAAYEFNLVFSYSAGTQTDLTGLLDPKIVNMN